MNLFETIKLVQDTAKETANPKLLAVPNDPENHLLIIGSKSEKIATPFVPQPRRHNVESIESFSAAFKRWATTTSEAGNPEPTANIWIDAENWELSFFTDEPLRRSWVKLTITPSPQLLLLQHFEQPAPIDQKVLVRMLRHDLADCVDAGVLAAFRTIDFQKIANVRQTVQHEKQSLDSDIVAQVTGEKKPDSFQVDFPLFAMRELEMLRTRVGVTIDIDCDNKKFVLQAKPGHLKMAIDDARTAVTTRLEADLSAAGLDGVEILAGSPTAD